MYKKDTNNYRTIHPIDIIAIIYDKFFLSRAESCIDDKCILAENQASIWQSCSTIANCFVMNHLITKYVMVDNVFWPVYMLVHHLTQ